MSNHLVKVGILGCANIAERFVIPAFLELNNLYSLEAIASRDKEKSKKLTNNFGGTPLGSYNELISNDNIHLVYIPLPNSLHAKWIEAALNSGKHVLVEKTMTCSLEETIHLNQLAKEKKLILIENFQFRFHSQLEIIKNIINSGELGELRNITSCFGFPPFSDKENIRYSKELGGGALLDAGAYPLKLTQEILGQDVYIDSASLNTLKCSSVDIWGGAQLKSRSKGVISQISFGFDNHYQCKLEVWCSEGIITAQRIFTSPPNQRAVITVKTNEGSKEISTDKDNHFKNLLEALYSMITSPEIATNEYECNINQARLIKELKEKSNE